jgi:RNA polymerase sigma-70 factor (ECF subfamily)
MPGCTLESRTKTELKCDQLIVAAFRVGDLRAFDLLVVKYQRRLMRLVSRLVREPAEAEYVVQETFIRAYRAMGLYRGQSGFCTWLYRIGINTAKNFLVAQTRRGQTVIEAHAGGFGPEPVRASKQIASTVNAAVESLPVDLRTAIILREIDGLKYEEISQVVACPIGIVRARISRAREVIAGQLRPLLKE